MTVVVTKIDISRRFYTEVLGGMIIEGLSTGDEGVFGDSHFYRIFQDEILEARSTGQSLEDIGVPDISNNGDYVVLIFFYKYMIYMGNCKVSASPTPHFSWCALVHLEQNFKVH